MIELARETELITVLKTVTDQLDTLGEELIFIGECPNKFNDADHDDIWYAVQAGKTFWEQSHFFKYSSVPGVREHSSFTLDATEEQILEAGSSVASERIAFLREQLGHLQKADWRGLCDWDALAALVYELDRWWLILENPNMSDGEVFTWDHDGFFFVGEVERIDQVVGGNSALTFQTVSDEELDRLNGPSKDFFFPVCKEKSAHKKLSEITWSAVQEIRLATKDAVALKSGKSKGFYPSGAREWSANIPISYSGSLRHREGEYRKPANGEWPTYQQNLRAEPTEYSDLAKALHTTIGKLEDQDWRRLFSEAFGETLVVGQTLALFADDELAVLVRDNAAFLIEPNQLSFFGIVDYPNCGHPAEVLSELRQLL